MLSLGLESNSQSRSSSVQRKIQKPSQKQNHQEIDNFYQNQPYKPKFQEQPYENPQQEEMPVYTKHEYQRNIKKQEIEDPFSRFRDLSYDQIKQRMKQLVYDRRKLLQSTKNSQIEAEKQDAKIQKLREKIQTKEEIIESNEKYLKELEDILINIKDKLGAFKDFKSNILRILESRVNVVEDSFESEIQDDEQITKFQNQNSEMVEDSLIMESKSEIKNRKFQNSAQIKFKGKKNSKFDDESALPYDSLGEDELEKECPYNKGLWNDHEKQLYQRFVEENKDILDVPELCYKVRIFRQMSNAIGTRSSKQCRTYHRQLCKKRR